MPSPSPQNRPKVGIAAIILRPNPPTITQIKTNTTPSILMGQRLSSHGTGTWQCPGGHQEYGESFAETAARECLEETGLVVGRFRFLTATNDVFKGEAEGKHYVTIFMVGEVLGGEGVARAMEPQKCAKWEWVPWSQMWAWAKEQSVAEDEGREVERKMFLPLVNLYREHPELEDSLVKR
ncbi:hypothetical protein T440DRAFT_555000 [Plenodomus tracheiphilus IPT5]|uniref:Nudix hydrolase domain-containing protein n=1 Tax=Plenodomus tracheiphilus IPT5 TaxID=1408161 RepID=A0A6A7B6Q4_9PLEO|nr:hypothetical protein T440DRAFT_555000 [Plenodomus tracheiphilus IPT5]